MNDLTREEIVNLLNHIALGDDKAVKTIYLHYQRSLFAFIRHRVPDDSAAEEILHDTFMVICRRPEGYDRTSKFSTWLCAIARHKAADWWRKRGRRPDEQEMDDEVIQEIPDNNGNILQLLEQEELSEVLRACVDRLPAVQREAIHHACYQDEKLEVIAQLQDCPVNTVKTRLFHARLKIKDCVERALGKEVSHGTY
ncbi:MAG: RNA polymerase sigma factor [Methylotenera sp.]